MNRIIKSYPEFLAEQLQIEGLKDIANRVVGSIKKFAGKGTGYLSALAAQIQGKKSKDGAPGTIPIGVTIYPSAYDLDQVGGEAPVEETETVFMNETIVPLDFPNPKAGVINVGYDELTRIVRRVTKYPDERPLMIWGSPGIGKTSIVKAVQKAYGGRLIDVQLTTYAPEDFFLPVTNSSANENPKSRRASRVPQEWLPVYHESEGAEGNAAANGPDGKGGVIFLDELSRAPVAIRNICLKLVLEREVDGGWKLGSKWIILAASNRMEDDETNTESFGTALGNRFQQVNYVSDIKSYGNYAMSAKDETGTDIFDPLIISFLNWSKGKEFFHKMDAGTSLAFPSPRSWEGAAVAWKNLKKDAEEEGYKLTPSMIEDEALAPNVGQEAATAFIAYYILSQKIDLDNLYKVYSDPMNAPLPPTARGKESEYELDAAYILAAAIAYEYRGRKLTDTEIENVIKYAVRANNPTVAMQIMSAIVEIHPYFSNISTANNDPAVAAYLGAMRTLFLPKYPGSAKELENLEK
jgi:hypothetical protein